MMVKKDSVLLGHALSERKWDMHSYWDLKKYNNRKKKTMIELILSAKSKNRSWKARAIYGGEFAYL